MVKQSAASAVRSRIPASTNVMIMRLIDLAVAIGMDAESCKKIQICHPGRNWEDYDEFNAGSELLKPFYDLKVKSLSAVNTDVIRVDLDFDEEV